MIDVLRFVVGLAADVVRGRAGLVAEKSCGSRPARMNAFARSGVAFEVS
jgi:hypothetical protein